MTKSKFPFVLLILDGWGLGDAADYNAIYKAKTPVFDKLWKRCPQTTLYAHGKYAGLPEGQVGNSEAGHLNLGAGRIVKQDSVYIDQSISDGTFFKNPAFKEVIDHTKKYHSKLHLMGILSGKQCPHMNPEHLKALFKLVKQNKVAEVILHLFTDGRDAKQKEALDDWQEIKSAMPKNIKVGTVCGRLYLDRKKKWQRTEKIYNALLLGQAEYKEKTFKEAVKKAYSRGRTDEFIEPTVIANKEAPLHSTRIEDGDGVIFFNLRSDRARQLTKPFVQRDFEAKNPNAIQRKKVLNNLKFVAMTDFGPDLEGVLTAYPSPDVKNTLPKALENVRQLYIAETEKYAHVTYFFNGGYADPINGEKRAVVASPDVKSYAEKPEMSAKEVTDIVIESIESKLFDFVAVNLANPDMVGHTGDAEACIKACEVVDKCLGQILKLILNKKGIMLIVADHGNIEKIKDPLTGEPDTMHETSLVPLILIDSVSKRELQKKTGKLADVAPTALELLGVKKPEEMTGRSLILK